MATKRIGKFIRVTIAEDTETLFSQRVELRLPQNKVAVAKHVKLDIFPNLDSKIADEMFVRFWASSNVDCAFGGGLSELSRMQEDQSVFYSYFPRLHQAVADLGGAVIWPSDQVPLYGFPLVGDCMASGSVRAADSGTVDMFLSIYYEELAVSTDEWLRLAKRQRNAPRDTMPSSVFNT